MAGGNTAAMHIVHFSGRIAGKRSRCAAAGRSMIVAGCAGPLLPVQFAPAALPATQGGRIESMKKSTEKSVTWSNLRCSLNDLDRPALIDLIRDLYTVSVDNQAFLHARFFQGEEGLEFYRALINRWVCPDFSRNQEISVARATKAVADYRQAAGHPEGLAELAVFYCESCKSHLSCCGMNDADYFNALADMFEQALQAIVTLDPAQQDVLVERLERVRHEGRNWGWGVGDEMNDLMAKYGLAGK